MTDAAYLHYAARSRSESGKGAPPDALAIPKPFLKDDRS